MEIKEISKFIKVTLYDAKDSNGTCLLINTSEISYIQERDKERPYVCVYMKDGAEFYVKNTFKDLENKIKEAKECYK